MPLSFCEMTTVMMLSSSGQPGEEFLAYPTLLSTTGDVQTTGATAWLYYVLKRAPDQLTSRTVVRRLVRF